jgi:hypothetical protein
LLLLLVLLVACFKAAAPAAPVNPALLVGVDATAALAASEGDAGRTPAPRLCEGAAVALSASLAKAAALPGLSITCLVILVVLGAGIDTLAGVACWVPAPAAALAAVEVAAWIVALDPPPLPLLLPLLLLTLTPLKPICTVPAPAVSLFAGVAA